MLYQLEFIKFGTTETTLKREPPAFHLEYGIEKKNIWNGNKLLNEIFPMTVSSIAINVYATQFMQICSVCTARNILVLVFFIRRLLLLHIPIFVSAPTDQVSSRFMVWELNFNKIAQNQIDHVAHMVLYVEWFWYWFSRPKPKCIPLIWNRHPII